MLRLYWYHFIRMAWIVRSILSTQIGLIMLGAVAMVRFENTSFGEATYFAFITGLTIGYGDIVASTTPGRITSVLLGLVGITFTGLMVAIAVRALHDALHESQSSE